MKIVTEKQLIDILLNTKGSSAISLVAVTKPEMRKTNNPHPEATKVSHVNGMIGFNYTNSVNNQRIREDGEPNFEAEPRRWGNRIQGTPLVEHKGRYYLEVKNQRVIRTEYRSENGEPIDSEVLKPFMREKTEGSRQDLDKPVVLRDFAVSNICQLRMMGEVFVVKGR